MTQKLTTQHLIYILRQNTYLTNLWTRNIFAFWIGLIDVDYNSHHYILHMHAQHHTQRYKNKPKCTNGFHPLLLGKGDQAKSLLPSAYKCVCLGHTLKWLVGCVKWCKGQEWPKNTGTGQKQRQRLSQRVQHLQTKWQQRGAKTSKSQNTKITENSTYGQGENQNIWRKQQKAMKQNGAQSKQASKPNAKAKKNQVKI